MAYTKQTWQDFPNKTTPINAARLGHIEDGIFNAAQVADSATTALGNKVDKVPGQGLSTNDYSNTDKGIVDGVTAALATKQPKTLDSPITIGGVSRTTVEAALGALEDNKEDTILAATPLVKEYDEVMRQDVLRLTMDDTPTANSNNPVKSSGIKSALSATVDLMKDTTGWTGKNFNKGNPNNVFVKSTARTQAFPFAKNVTQGKKYTVSFDVSAISGYTGNIALGVRFIGNDNAHDWNVPTSASGRVSHTFTASTDATEGGANSHVYMFISSTESDNATITVSNIMFTDADVPDQTYEPYHESVELSKYNRSEANVLGAKNLFPIDLNTLKAKNTTGTWSDNVYSLNNATITCTVENGYVTEITANSENPISQNTNFILFDGSNSTNLVNSFKGKELTLNGCPKNGSNTSYRMLFSTWGTVENKYDDGNGCTIDVPNNVTGMRFDVILYSGYTPNNLKFRPMIRLASDTDPTFAPYAMTNRELTESLKYRNVQLTPVPNTGTNYEKVVNVAEQLDALITDVGVKFSGYVLWTQSMFLRVEAMRCNATTLLYTIFNVSNTIYNGAVQNGAVTVYKFEGTQMTS